MYELTGPRLMTFREITEELGKATGRDIKFQDISVEEYARDTGRIWTAARLCTVHHVSFYGNIRWKECIPHRWCAAGIEQATCRFFFFRAEEPCLRDLELIGFVHSLFNSTYAPPQVRCSFPRACATVNVSVSSRNPDGALNMNTSRMVPPGMFSVSRSCIGGCTAHQCALHTQCIKLPGITCAALQWDLHGERSAGSYRETVFLVVQCYISDRFL